MVDLPLNGRNYTTLLETIPCAAGASAAVRQFQLDRAISRIIYTVERSGRSPISVSTSSSPIGSIVDAIAELKGLDEQPVWRFTEFHFRASGAPRSKPLTKSGTKQFHGTGWWFKRGRVHERATSISSGNLSGAQRSIYRFMQAGFNIGGPVLRPFGLNKDRNKLFFFSLRTSGEGRLLRLL